MTTGEVGKQRRADDVGGFSDWSIGQCGVGEGKFDGLVQLRIGLYRCARKGTE